MAAIEPVPIVRPKARIGMVNFINTAPLYAVWQRTVRRPEWQITEAPPAELNRLLYRDQLDLGFVSSHEYAAHPAAYKILSDLSISSSGPVGSVLLLSKVEPRQLTGEQVVLSTQSRTSVSLVKIILEEFYQVQPRYLSGAATGPEAAFTPAVLAIGDDALRLRRRGDYPVQLDLGEVWRQQTGLPFVFAVWAVRRDFCAREMDSVTEIHQELLRCVQEGREELRVIASQVAGRIPMPPAECYEYLRGLEYDLAPAKQEALRCFFEFLIKRGEGAPEALPLQICG